jgi:hypothetical protein
MVAHFNFIVQLNIKKFLPVFELSLSCVDLRLLVSLLYVRRLYTQP